MNIENKKNGENLRELILTALMIALIFIGGTLIKIPTFNGFMQFGDCMVFLAAVLLDRKKAFIAAAIGMSFVDVSAGYLIWVPFTFIIKGVMAYITSILVHKIKGKLSYIISFIVGGIISVAGYFVANAIMGGIILKVVSGFTASIVYAGAHFAGDLIPIIFSIIVAIPIVAIVKKIIK